MRHLIGSEAAIQRFTDLLQRPVVGVRASLASGELAVRFADGRALHLHPDRSPQHPALLRALAAHARRVDVSRRFARWLAVLGLPPLPPLPTRPVYPAPGLPGDDPLLAAEFSVRQGGGHDRLALTLDRARLSAAAGIGVLGEGAAPLMPLWQAQPAMDVLIGRAGGRGKLYLLRSRALSGPDFAAPLAALAAHCAVTLPPTEDVAFAAVDLGQPLALKIYQDSPAVLPCGLAPPPLPAGTPTVLSRRFVGARLCDATLHARLGEGVWPLLCPALAARLADLRRAAAALGADLRPTHLSWMRTDQTRQTLYYQLVPR